jgi:large conductance mechanosensitive channel
MLNGFKQFILKGNVVDLAVGVAIGVSFGAVVTALVKDVVTPIIGAFGGTPDFSSLSFSINNSKFLIGDFINALLSFIITSAVVYFFIVIPMNKLLAQMNKGKSVDPTEKSCSECLSLIPLNARRCKFCTSIQVKK